MVPLGQQHLYKGETIAFLNDSIDNKSFPPTIKLNNDDFQEAKAWFCLGVNTIMDANQTLFTTLLVPHYNNIVITTKIILILLLLIPLFLNGGDTLNTVGAFQMFMDEFYDNALEELEATMQYIYDYLLAAMGHDKSLEMFQNMGSQRSQLACDIEILPMDQVLSDWSMTHFGGILHWATKFDKSKVQIQVETDQQMINNVPLSSLITKAPPGQALQQTLQELIIGTQSSLIICRANAIGNTGYQPQPISQYQLQIMQENPAQGNLTVNILQAQVHRQAGVTHAQQGIQQQLMQGNPAQENPTLNILQVQVHGQAGVAHAQQGVQQQLIQGNPAQGSPTSNTLQGQFQRHAGVAHAQQGIQQQLLSFQVQRNKQQQSALQKQQQNQQQ